MDIIQGSNSQTEFHWKNFWDKARKVLPFALLIVAAFVLAKYINIAQLKEFLNGHEKLGILACLLAYVLLGVTAIPSDPITLLAITWKGPVVAVLLAAIGNTLSSMIDFYVGKSIRDLADFEKQKAKLPLHLGQLPVNSPVFLIGARMLTSFGSKFVSIAAGAYHVPMFTYIWTSLVANLIGANLIVFGGVGLIHFFQRILRLA